MCELWVHTTSNINVGLLMTPFYDVWPRDTAPGPRIRLSVLMVLSDDGEMTLCVLWAGLIRLAMSPRLASVHIATNLSHCHDGNILSQTNYKELTRSSEKINKNHYRGFRGCLMLARTTDTWLSIGMIFWEYYKSPTFAGSSDEYWCLLVSLSGFRLRGSSASLALSLVSLVAH